jgi:hypothetical protein
MDKRLTDLKGELDEWYLEDIHGNHSQLWMAISQGSERLVRLIFAFRGAEQDVWKEFQRAPEVTCNTLEWSIILTMNTQANPNSLRISRLIQQFLRYPEADPLEYIKDM